MADINIESLRKIMQDFYTLSHIRIALLDCDIKEKISYPEPQCPFCAYIRETPELDNKCYRCDDEAFKNCKKRSSPMIYTCHAGLLEVIIPVKDNDKVLCYIMFGQVVDSAVANQQRETIYQNFQGTGLDDEKLRTVVQLIDSRSRAEISASATILESLALYVLTKRYVAPSRVRFIEMLDQYIDAHLREKILISDLCSHFCVSRTRLYELSRPYLDCGLSDYIQRRRVKQAMNLLATTDTPISEIAADTGFSDYNYFRRVFKEMAGQSAKAYRNALRLKDDEEKSTDA